MVIIKLFACDLQIILLFYIYSSTKSILLTCNITHAVLVKLQCLHQPSFIIQCRHLVNVKIQASLWFKRTCNHLWNSSVTKQEKRWMIPIKIYIVYNVVLMKNDTIVSVIICYNFYHIDFDMFFVLWWTCLCMIYANFNIVVYLWLLEANIGTPLMCPPVVKG